MESVQAASAEPYSSAHLRSSSFSSFSSSNLDTEVNRLLLFHQLLAFLFHVCILLAHVTRLLKGVLQLELHFHSKEYLLLTSNVCFRQSMLPISLGSHITGASKTDQLVLCI